MASGKLNLSRGVNDRGDVNDAAVFLVALTLLLLVAMVLFFGGNWLLPPTVPTPRF